MGQFTAAQQAGLGTLLSLPRWGRDLGCQALVQVKYSLGFRPLPVRFLSSQTVNLAVVQAPEASMLP